jgi:hypothetical protein
MGYNAEDGDGTPRQAPSVVVRPRRRWRHQRQDRRDHHHGDRRLTGKLPFDLDRQLRDASTRQRVIDRNSRLSLSPQRRSVCWSQCRVNVACSGLMAARAAAVISNATIRPTTTTIFTVSRTWRIWNRAELRSRDTSGWSYPPGLSPDCIQEPAWWPPGRGVFMILLRPMNRRLRTRVAAERGDLKP